MTSTERPLIETIRQCSPAVKAAILAALLQERTLEDDGRKPLSIEDEHGKRIGTFIAAIKSKPQRPTSPPILSPERRAELQRRYENMDNAISVEEMLSSLNLDDPPPGSES